MPPSPTLLVQAVPLSRSLTARLLLHPMPTPDASGGYPLRCDSDSFDIRVRLLCGDALLDEKRWNELVGPWPAVTLADGTVLGEADLHALDSRGWAILRGYGLVPTSWAGG